MGGKTAFDGAACAYMERLRNLRNGRGLKENDRGDVLDGFRTRVCEMDPADVCELLWKKAEGENWFFTEYLKTHGSQVMQGFQAHGTGASAASALALGRVRSVARALARELVLCSNAVLLWRSKRRDGVMQFPGIQVMNGGAVRRIETSYGIEELEIELPFRKLPTSQKEREEFIAQVRKNYGDAYADAIRDRKDCVTLRQGQDDWNFYLVTAGALGSGRCRPALQSVLEDLELVALLSLADWTGAFMHKDIVRYAKKGVIVTSGNRAGQILHLWTTGAKGLKQKVLEFFEKLKGGADLTVSADTELGHFTFDPSFFSAEKFEGAMRRLAVQAGALAPYLLSGSSRDAGLITQVSMNHRPWIAEIRAMVEEGLRAAFGSITWQGDFEKEVGSLRFCWDQSAAMPPDAAFNHAQMLWNNGAMSTQTLRESWGGLDHEEESRRMVEEGSEENRDGVSRIFESRQGIASGRWGFAGAGGQGDGEDGGDGGQGGGGGGADNNPKQ